VIFDSDEGRRLADAIEARACADMYAAADASLQLRSETLGGATLLFAPRLPVTYFNRVIGLGVAEPATEALVGAVLERYRTAGVGEFWVHLNPAARPAKLADWLTEHGLALPPRRSWAKFLRGVERSVPRASELPIRQALPRDAEAVAKVACAAYGMPPFLAPWFAALGGRPGWRFVVAEANGSIAATGAAFVHGNTAWLGVGSTLAEHRGRGAQSALLAARIGLAADAGCTVLATETGESIAGEVNPSLNNIRRAGFEQVCSRLNLAAKR
jgi:GNAT superfamily N-acetyltransferase